MKAAVVGLEARHKEVLYKQWGTVQKKYQQSVQAVMGAHLKHLQDTRLGFFALRNKFLRELTGESASKAGAEEGLGSGNGDDAGVRKQLLLDAYVAEYNSLLKEYPHMLLHAKAKQEFHFRLQQMREKFSAETTGKRERLVGIHCTK